MHIQHKNMEKNSSEAINCDGKKRINQKQLENAPGHSNIAFRTQYCSSKFRRKRYDIQDCED